jgi:hypothetical protein
VSRAFLVKVDRRHHRLLGDSVAADGADEEDRELVTDQLAAKAGEDWRGRLVKHARHYWTMLYTHPAAPPRFISPAIPHRSTRRYADRHVSVQRRLIK